MTLLWLRRRLNPSRSGQPGGRAPSPRVRPRLEALEARTLLTAGYLDPTFNNGGLVGIPKGTPAPVSPGVSQGGGDRVTVQPDGKIVVAMSSSFFGIADVFESSLVLARYNPDGSLDAAFGPDRSGNDFFGDMALQGDGKVVLAWETGAPVPPAIPLMLFVQRFNPDGSLDPTFTADPGLQPGGTRPGPTAIAVQPDGGLLVVTEVFTADDPEYLVARLDPSGRLDPSFGTGGEVTYRPPRDDFAPRGVAAQADGKVLVVGTTDLSASGTQDFVVLRLDAAGRPDPSFGSNGRAQTSFGGDAFATRVFVQPDGHIVVTGSVTGASSQPSLINGFAAARYTAAGALDASFGDGGKLVAPAPFTATGAAAVQADGALVAALRDQTTAGANLVTDLVRFTAAGQLDATFGKGGVVATAFPTSAAGGQLQVADVAVQPDGRLLATGTVAGTLPFDGTRHFGLARYVPVEERTPNERVVSQMYLDLLFRPVDPSGLAHWSGLLDQGVPRTDVVRSIQASDEYLAAVVRDAYQRLLGRLPDAGGSAAWAQFLAAGASQDQLEASLLGSAEYFSDRGRGTNDGFLAALYHDALGRAIDPSGQASWGQALAQGASRTDVALAVLGSAEADGVTVDRLYQRFLGRPADDFGRTAFTGALQQGASNDAVIADIVGSPEYFDRAQ
jgi:uncharacterized delta-60 repeat protein